METEKRASPMNIIKAVCMLGLPLIHTLEELESYGVMNVGANSSYDILLVLTALGPGVFLICMGFDFGSSSSVKQMVRLGKQMLIIGFALSLLRFVIPEVLLRLLGYEFDPWERILGYLVQSDIYYFAGLFYLLYAFFKKRKMNDFQITISCLLMLTLNTILMESGVPRFDFFPLECLVGNFVYCGPSSCFPVLSWSIFPMFGILIYKSLKESKKEKMFPERLLVGSLSCLIALYVALGYQGVDLYAVTVSPQNEYITELFNVTIQILLAVFVIGLIQLIIDKTQPNAVESFLDSLSAYLMPYYCIHWVLVVWLSLPLVMAFGETESVSVLVACAFALVITVLSVYLSKKYGMKLMRKMLKLTNRVIQKTEGKKGETS